MSLTEETYNQNNNTEMIQKYRKQEHEKKVQERQVSAPWGEENVGKWELDVEPFIDSIYHELLGESLIGGVWTIDEKRKRSMNELGASEYIKEIRSRVSLHMQLSDLSEEDITEMASRSSENFGDKLEDSIHDGNIWELEQKESNYVSIVNSLYDILKIALTIAKQGGMKTHRENSKNPYANLPQQQDQQGGMI